MSDNRVPVALTVAGSDSSGGAGIQADLKTFSALGVYGASVITALTAQNTRGVSGVLGVPPDFIAAQFRSVVSDLNVAAIKTGMLGDVATVEIVARLLAEAGARNIVVDPVMVATSGDVLLGEDAIAALRETLLPLAHLITPNLPEAAKLLGTAPAATIEDMRAQARDLLQFGCKAVLLKGGHGEGRVSPDVLATGGGVREFAMPRITTRHTHGTGCTLSAAIAAGMALALPLEEAVVRGKDFVWRAIRSGSGMHVGAGNGPVDHLFERHGKTGGGGGGGP